MDGLRTPKSEREAGPRGCGERDGIIDPVAARNDIMSPVALVSIHHGWTLVVENLISVRLSLGWRHF